MPNQIYTGSIVSSHYSGADTFTPENVHKPSLAHEILVPVLQQMYTTKASQRRCIQLSPSIKNMKKIDSIKQTYQPKNNRMKMLADVIKGPFKHSKTNILERKRHTNSGFSFANDDNIESEQGMQQASGFNQESSIRSSAIVKVNKQKRQVEPQITYFYSPNFRQIQPLKDTVPVFLGGSYTNNFKVQSKVAKYIIGVTKNVVPFNDSFNINDSLLNKTQAIGSVRGPSLGGSRSHEPSKQKFGQNTCDQGKFTKLNISRRLEKSDARRMS